MVGLHKQSACIRVSQRRLHRDGSHLQLNADGVHRDQLCCCKLQPSRYSDVQARRVRDSGGWFQNVPSYRNCFHSPPSRQHNTISDCCCCCWQPAAAEE